MSKVVGAIKKNLKLAYIRCKYRGCKVKISNTSEVSTKSTFEGYNKIHEHVYFKGKIGRFSYIGANSYINAKIGRFTSIAPNVRVLISRHPYTYPYVSTSPAFFSTKKQCNQSFVEEDKFSEQEFIYDGYAVEIGSDCWIGDSVLIVSGVKIGDGAVVLAGAVVTKDVEPYSIVGGIPCSVKKFRYSNEDIEYLCRLKWWNKPLEWIKKNSFLFIDFDSFKNNQSK